MSEWGNGTSWHPLRFCNEVVRVMCVEHLRAAVDDSELRKIVFGSKRRLAALRPSPKQCSCKGVHHRQQPNEKRSLVLDTGRRTGLQKISSFARARESATLADASRGAIDRGGATVERVLHPVPCEGQMGSERERNAGSTHDVRSSWDEAFEPVAFGSLPLSPATLPRCAAWGASAGRWSIVLNAHSQ